MALLIARSELPLEERLGSFLVVGKKEKVKERLVLFHGYIKGSGYFLALRETKELLTSTVPLVLEVSEDQYVRSNVGSLFSQKLYSANHGKEWYFSADDARAFFQYH